MAASVTRSFIAFLFTLPSPVVLINLALEPTLPARLREPVFLTEAGIRLVELVIGNAHHFRPVYLIQRAAKPIATIMSPTPTM